MNSMYQEERNVVSERAVRKAESREPLAAMVPKAQRAMRILFFTNAHNGMSQALYLKLTALGHQVRTLLKVSCIRDRTILVKNLSATNFCSSLVYPNLSVLLLLFFHLCRNVHALSIFVRAQSAPHRTSLNQPFPSSCLTSICIL